MIAGGGGLIKQQNKVLAINKKSVVGWDGEEELYVKKYIATKPIFFFNPYFVNPRTSGLVMVNA